MKKELLTAGGLRSSAEGRDKEDDKRKSIIHRLLRFSQIENRSNDRNIAQVSVAAASFFCVIFLSSIFLSVPLSWLCLCRCGDEYL
jgi:hypothetical protein